MDGINTEAPIDVATNNKPVEVKKESKRDYHSRLAEYLTGIPLEDEKRLSEKLMADRNKLDQEFKFPPVEQRIEDPKAYKEKILGIANANGVKIISLQDLPDWYLEKNPMIKKMKEGGSKTSGFYEEESLNSIVLGDPSSEDPGVLRALAHELVHALDYKKMKSGDANFSIEQLEYRAYLYADYSKRQVENYFIGKSLFSDGRVAGSGFGYYYGKFGNGDFGDFCKKAENGTIKIPWYGLPESDKTTS